MTAISTPAAVTPTTGAAPADAVRRPLAKAGLAGSVAAAAVTTGLAAIASAAGVSFADTTGASIPLAGFAQITLIFSLLGVILAALVARKARKPRSTFVRTTVALTALSLIPDVTFGFDAASAITLMALHLVAAAIVVPVLAARLARTAR